jgi:hypothetical protein
MRIATRTLIAAVCAALPLLAGCGGDSITGPSSTSGSSGATVVGIVNGAAGAAMSANAGPTGATAPSGLTVTVVGTNLSSSVDTLGHFEITGVPSGTIKLQFTDATVNATVEIANVGSDDLIQIRVTVTGSTATVESQQRSTGKVSLCHSTGSGSYHMIDVSVSAEPAHRQHGDAKVGDPVPAEPTKVFDDQCRPVSVGASVNIEKSTNGEDADNAPGPTVLVGSAITWTYVVTNTGAVNLTNVVVADDRGVAVNCAGQTALVPGQSMTCTGSGVAILGQYRNVGTVTASWTGGTVADSDASHYFGKEPTDDEGEGPKVQLCHRTGNGRYHLIEVSVSAEPAHRAHGDGKIGEAVPGSTGKVFGAGCTVQ